MLFAAIQNAFSKVPCARIKPTADNYAIGSYISYLRSVVATPRFVEATKPVITSPLGQANASSDARNSRILKNDVSQSISGPGEADIAWPIKRQT